MKVVSTHAPLRQRGERVEALGGGRCRGVSTHAPLRQRGELSAFDDQYADNYRFNPRPASSAGRTSSSVGVGGVLSGFNPRPASSAGRT